MDAPETHPVHHHKSGHSLFDFIMGGTAVLVSLISLWVAVHHGETMEKLVKINSYPNIEFGVRVNTGIASGSVALDVGLKNSGVGPGRIETLELAYDGKPLRNRQEIIAKIQEIGGNKKLTATISSSTTIGSLVGAGKDQRIFGIDIAAGDIWRAPAMRVAQKLSAKVCYCSVFEECYVENRRTGSRRAAPVKFCPPVTNAFDDNEDISDLARNDPAKK